MEKLREIWSGLSGIGKALAVGFVVVGLAVVAGSGDTDAAPNTPRGSVAPTTTQAPSDAFKLATIDSGTYPSDASVARYSSALNRLEGRCVAQPGTGHSDYAVRASQILAEEGISSSALEILNAVAESLSEPGTESLNLQCSEVYALLVTLMVNG